MKISNIVETGLTVEKNDDDGSLMSPMYILNKPSTRTGLVSSQVHLPCEGPGTAFSVTTWGERVGDDELFLKPV